MSRFKDIMRKSDFYEEPDKSDDLVGETNFSLSELQSDLNAMNPSERVISLGKHEKIEVFIRLEQLREQHRKEDAFALFSEYREFISPTFFDHEDYDESYWFSSNYLKQLRLARKISSHFEK